MNNPLTKEQIIKLNEIAKLPVEEQKEELQDFLKTLNKEQIEFLKNQQQTAKKCLFCSIIDGSINSFKVYEDSHAIAILDINPASKGHTLVIPKKHYAYLTNSEDLDHIFESVKIIVNKIYETYKADTNIVISNGSLAGQNLDHLSIHIIPRYENDGINLKWKQIKIAEDELANIARDLRIKPKFEQPKPVIKLDLEEDERIP